MQTSAGTMVESEAASASNDLPASFLSCYEITNAYALRWSARLYRVRQNDGELGHADRGKLKQVIWSLRKKHRDLCKGYGFVIDVSEDTVAVPGDWQLPTDAREGEFVVTFDRKVTTDPTNPADHTLIAGILREGIKGQFKNTRSDLLGELWQDYDKFCQVPQFENGEQFHFCRKFGAHPKVLRGNRWVIQPVVSTATLDGMTFADYFRIGEVVNLIGMIDAKQANRLDRDNRPTAVRVLRTDPTFGDPKYGVIELDAPNLLDGFASLSKQDQALKADGTIRCRPFASAPIDVPLSELRLVLDTQITQSDHSQTILEPSDRNYLANAIQDFLDGMSASKVTVHLSQTPVDFATLPNEIVALPALRVRDEGPMEHKERIVPAPRFATENALRTRGQQRRDALKKFGFLQGHPINPLLAWPKRIGPHRATRMADDLNRLLASAGITYHFTTFLYSDVEDLRRHVEKNRFDALLAVLPEGWRRAFREDSTHELIKQRIDVPSQCIQHDNTLPEVWVGKSHNDIQREDVRLARRVAQRYELCLWNLFAKLGWVPFAPADPFAYNVHVGLDVGGQHNNRAMACLGYGFASPRDGLLFRPEAISISVQKAEPIPTDPLKNGLLKMFEQVHAELTATRTTPNFEKALFFRDGRLLGDGGAWNELDALKAVYDNLRNRGWISDKAVWTAVEVMKHAEDWRLMRGGDDVVNPLVGQCVFPFDDESTGLVCTTGLPYLPQGLPIAHNFLGRAFTSVSSALLFGSGMDVQ